MAPFTLCRDSSTDFVRRTERCLAGTRTTLHARKKPRHSSDQACRATAVPLEKLPLSSYNFPSLPSKEVNGLESIVRSTVTHIEEAPLLQLQQNGVISHHAVDDTVLQSSQLREVLAEYLVESDVDMVALVHPLESPAPRQAVRRVQGHRDVMTGISNLAPRLQRLQSFAEFLRRSGTPADFYGRVGECCDEETAETFSQVVAFPQRHHFGRGGRRHDGHESSAHGWDHGFQGGLHHGSFSSSTEHRDDSKYWGVVVQSKNQADAGCFVLKTTDSSVGDCTCVHWSLTRVRRGVSIVDQLSSAWLAS